jgi:hypothetical protein
MRFLKPINFNYTSATGKKLPGRIIGTGTKQGVKDATFEVYYNDMIGWKEVSNLEIKRKIYLKYKKQIEAK